MLKFKLFFASCMVFCTLLANAQSVSEHGYRYFHHRQNAGLKPQRGESVQAHVDVYAGNTLLSSSKKNPNGIYRYDIPAPEENLDHFPPILDAVVLMAIGDSITIFQTVDDNMRQYLPPTEKDQREIRFEVVLTDIVNLEQKAIAASKLEASVQVIAERVQAKTKAYTIGLLNAQIQKTATGLKLLVEEKGGGAPVQEGEPLQVHYYGCLTNGTPFDNSFIRRQPLQFPAGVGQMIAGFDEGVMRLNHGARAYLFIPPSLGYGSEEVGDGLIPANSELVFYIEIL